jgi:hypothetical protein
VGLRSGHRSLPDALDTISEEYAIKLDWNISDQHRANFRYSSSDQSQANVVGFGNNSLALSSYLYQRDFKFDTTTAQLFSDWTDTFSTEFKLSLPRLLRGAYPGGGPPAIGVRIGNAFLNLGTEENTHANILETETWNSYFIGNWFLGDHEVKFGVDYENNDIYNLFGRRTNGVYTFNSIADYRAGRSSRYQLFAPAGGDLDNMAAVWGLDNVGLFLQDTWSVNYNLTFTYGVRIDTPYVDEEPVFNAAASTAFGFDNSNTIDGKELIQPRFGFNYTFDYRPRHPVAWWPGPVPGRVGNGVAVQSVLEQRPLLHRLRLQYRHHALRPGSRRPAGSVHAGRRRDAVDRLHRSPISPSRPCGRPTWRSTTNCRGGAWLRQPKSS